MKKGVGRRASMQDVSRESTDPLRKTLATIRSRHSLF